MNITVIDTVPGNPNPITITLTNVTAAQYGPSRDPAFPGAIEFHAQFTNGSGLSLRSTGQIETKATP